MEKDVICGMQVDPRTAGFSSQHSGKTFYFCSQQCKVKFDAAPTKFAPPKGVK